ncbi:MAG: long-chain fatty acid--CoA ligase, partial [Deltaproteobacteria bacterium]|nr:long-chain fatty acid--CoA ligase [Deltaproteobacteria bacterium]
ILLLACHKAGILCCFPPMTFRHKELTHILMTLNAAAVVTPMKYRNTDYLGMAKEIATDLPGLKHFIVIADEAHGETVSFRDLMETDPGPEDPEKYLEPFAFNPFEVSMVVLSSGTTGMPKCIEHTGSSCRVAGQGVAQRAKITYKDIVGNIAPLSGGPGLQNWWAAFQAGATTCILERFTPEGAFDFIQKEGITYLAAIPTQIIKMLKEADPGKYDLGSLRVVRTGAAAFDAALARETEDRLQCTVLIAGGSQETYSFAQTGVEDSREKRLATLGKPFPGNEVRIRDDQGQALSQGEVGQLWVRGAATSSGYFGDMETTLAAWGRLGKGGWYQTGDLAKLDDEGYLVLVGRKKEIIIRGGQNIYPKEIEDQLLTHPKIMQAVVLGIPDQVMGERACACIVLKDNEMFTFEEMVTFLKGKGLAIHKLPERLEKMAEFPQLVDGQKIDKISIKKSVLEKS